MWARVIEFMLACWLAISPFIFDYSGDAYFLWINDFACAIALAFFALISFYPPLKKMHLCNLLVALYMISLAYILPMQPAVQNYMVLGLIFLMLAIIPTDASHQPKPWRDFYKEP